MKNKPSTPPSLPMLAALPFLEGMHLAQLQGLDGCAVKTSFAARELIFREGDPARRFYVILSGSVALESSRKDGGQICIQTLGPGDVLGWSWMFPPYRWHFDARALVPVSAIFFHGPHLLGYGRKDPAFGYALVRRMAEVMLGRLQATRRQLQEISALALQSQWETLHLAARLGMVPKPVKRHVSATARRAR